MNEKPLPNPDREFVDSNVQRIVGFTVLRRIRKFVDEYQEEERQKSRLILWTIVFIGGIIGLAYLYGFTKIFYEIRGLANPAKHPPQAVAPSKRPHLIGVSKEILIQQPGTPSEATIYGRPNCGCRNNGVELQSLSLS
jgi:hypothetical protein